MTTRVVLMAVSLSLGLCMYNAGLPPLAWIFAGIAYGAGAVGVYAATRRTISRVTIERVSVPLRQESLGPYRTPDGDMTILAHTQFGTAGAQGLTFLAIERTREGALIAFELEGKRVWSAALTNDDAERVGVVLMVPARMVPVDDESPPIATPEQLEHFAKERGLGKPAPTSVPGKGKKGLN